MISITNNINNATVITHAGVFHADDVFATVILSKTLLSPAFSVYRTISPLM